MRTAPRTPEELETLFEGAFLLPDRNALIELLDDGAVLVAWAPRHAELSRSRDQPRLLRERDFSYLAEPRRVLQKRVPPSSWRS